MLFKGFLCCGASVLALQVLEPRHPAAEEPLSFRILQISSFANHSWVCTHGSGWLGELQTHSWDNVLGTIRFLLPWAQGNFSKEELKNIQAFLKLYFHSFPQEVQAFSSQLQFEYPFELQLSLGCLSRPVKASESFFNGAYQGSDFLSFQGNSWTPSLGAGSQAQNACTVLNHYRVIKEIVEVALYDICPRFLAGLLQAGKSELERQGGISIVPTLICLMVVVTLVLLVVVDSLFKKQPQIGTSSLLMSPTMTFPLELTPKTPGTQDLSSAWHKICGSKTDS